jgi:hypothetical protein
MKSSHRGASAETARGKTSKAKIARASSASGPASLTRGGRDPRGGLTTLGRKHFREKDGSRLKPGVIKPAAQMTADEMRRKGGWAARFYGRKSLPPLEDAQGRPTRFALSAHAWGEPVPKTEAAARRIAEKGRRLLQRHRALKEKS